MGKKVILTGDRPTGKLHIGHYIGSLKNRVVLQESGLYESFIMIADQQALTDNARNPEKIRNSLTEVALDYLAVGIDPSKSNIFVQSQIPELNELTMHYLNLVTLSRLERNPTVKQEIKQKNFENSIPAGFLIYPVSQAADITAFKADTVPVGEDQLPMIEQTREIVRSFNSIYGEVLVEPEAVLPSSNAGRLPGTDGKAKMSKSIGNCIYLSDDADTIKKKVMSMYTDPNHIRVEDPGQVEGNTVFTYLDVFATDKNAVEEMKEHYKRGGLGDVKVKKYLNEILQAELEPIRNRRIEFEKDIDAVYKMLKDGSNKAREVAANTLREVREAIGIEYFTGK
ncbi:tryptophan--tRNA ligase [Clostridium beijerinckii]|jgi:tryptophanyl-tRNA synthetase (EC 6.1.1.2)|uniref:Tryptophan--tRNA ligase n=2 Tax=Clostridium beijerinckii TaxID=1520 RepID=A0AAE2RNV1_CLOBE|nr:tryptophan--tRNA ligase [Clostridium beijerinckii]ABR32982.1 tryptophanyl-tRNA synthetase [Clostridium beijerinckii NCIMB 8052]AIU04745.1 tryptophanyl-tRNA synthetase [Clostridium beijerinckii ATCC 35702]MBF7807337.1 tryptophan--tRNA ligase [Clostridium beijerinckii]NRT25772.1 tryptophanyl-tRNA synthetase [Clostridium beijerinckii]NRT66633.1 tryptophanyl-tRNA synthetase [Clostridium beijerinckii]